MSPLPLVFQFGNLVFGRGFAAFVATRGKVLLVDEEDGVWMYGVQPGGMAAHGATRDAALQSFRVDYHRLLEEAAADAPDLPTFEANVRAIFGSVHAPAHRDWESARHDLQGSTAELARLPSVSARDFRSGVEVVGFPADDFDPRLLLATPTSPAALPSGVHYGTAA